MKITILTLCLVFLGLASAFAQSSPEPITIKNIGGGNQYFQNDRRLSMSKLARKLEVNEKAFTEIKRAQSNHALANVLGGIGGFMVGWPVGTVLGGGEPNWTLAAIGAGLIVVSVPITRQVNKQVATAVGIYNDGLVCTPGKDKAQISFSFAGNGVGLKLKF